jgi:hypothetical protein
VERLLQHKRLRDCMEKWNEQVTEYRRWCLRQEETGRDGKFTASSASDSTKRGNKSNKTKRKKQRTAEPAASAWSTVASFQRSVFVKLGPSSEGGVKGGDDDVGGSDERNPGDYYGPSGGAAKTNRPGQRARKAKAEAIRAKEEGVTRARSLNWREPKKIANVAAGATSSEGRNRSRTPTSSAAAQHRKDPAPPSSNSRQDEKAHPSWQAASLKANTGGIVPFRGTKITF